LQVIRLADAVVDDSVLVIPLFVLTLVTCHG
jgi:hypothetical protein